MNKSIKYFKDPGLIKMYQMSSYDDERHYAVARFLAAAGCVFEGCDDFKHSLTGALLGLVMDSSGKYTNNQEFADEIEQYYLAYKKLINLFLGYMTAPGHYLPEDIKKVVMKTTETPEYAIMLFFNF